MDPSEESRHIFETWRTLPKWGGRNGCYSVNWDYPDFYNKHAEKISQCPKLQEEIVQLCQTVLDSGQFDIDWVELRFYKQGLIIDVPGNACGIYPDPASRGSYGSHNVDTRLQVFPIFFFFITALDKIYSSMIVWEDNPEAGIESGPVDRNYRLVKRIEAKRYKLYEIKDNNFNTFAVTYARSSDEAEELTKKFDLVAEMIPIHFPQPYSILSTLRKFKVTVSWEAAEVEDSYHEVLASSSDHAEELVRQELENTPSLFPIRDITAANKGEILRPGVIK